MSRKEPLSYYCPGCDAVKSSPGECPDCGTEFLAADASPEDVAIRDMGGMSEDEDMVFDDDPTSAGWYDDGGAMSI